MKIPFYKYHGTGNDFVVIDNREAIFEKVEEAMIPWLCHRQWGIGADGLILLQDHPQYDFEMVYYNADASQSLCGNGSRCALHFAQFLTIIEDRASFLTTDGVHEGFFDNDTVFVSLHDVPGMQHLEEGIFVDTGSPHYIEMVTHLDRLDVLQKGRAIRMSQPFHKEGTNVNFVEQKGDQFYIRTYERGVESETLSCGTGAVGAALALSEQGFPSPIMLQSRGGELIVQFEKTPEGGFSHIYLGGAVAQVFTGTLDLDSLQHTRESHSQ